MSKLREKNSVERRIFAWGMGQGCGDDGKKNRPNGGPMTDDRKIGRHELRNINFRCVSLN